MTTEENTRPARMSCNEPDCLCTSLIIIYNEQNLAFQKCGECGHLVRFHSNAGRVKVDTFVAQPTEKNEHS